MRTDTPALVRLSEYRPFPFRLVAVRLTFRLDPDATAVVSRLTVERCDGDRAPLRLDGEKLTLRRIEINGAPLAAEAFSIDADGLSIHDPPDRFELLIETEIAPAANTELSGLYMSAGRFCTQCEAEGFRRITYYPDRPDVLAPFHVRIEASPRQYPFLLSNGNLVAEGVDVEGGGFAEWSDPHPKPSYLFALVGGDFDTLEDRFTTQSGRPVRLVIYVDKGDAARAGFALDSLKASMRWDETAFGREYDLDIFQIVAVRDFNFGAMENKGLNIFNSAYVLADGESATDADFEAIESIVAHEYFHNWTGNRITCRDWFQLCLKEGLTVYRDQEFTKSMRSPAVTRIKEVIRLRTRQFAEDAGPLAHPVRPDGYGRIDNLYTATVYEKGAEIIRMLRLFIGDDAFLDGMNRYFSAQDGKAATIEDFIAALQGATDKDLSDFMIWYEQAGTPLVTARSEYDGTAKALRLTLTQTTPPTPGQPHKRALPVPVRCALFGDNGDRFAADLDGRSQTEHTLVLRATSQTFEFLNVPASPLLSLNRGFSAPVRLIDGMTEQERARLAGADDDPFAQWEALQTIARAIITDQVGKDGPEMAERKTAFIAALASAVEKTLDDPALAALLLYTPTIGELIQDAAEVDPEAFHTARHALRHAVAERMRGTLMDAATAPPPPASDVSAAATGRRALKGASLSLLAALGADSSAVLAEAFESAASMTEKLAALSALSAVDGAAFDDALSRFETRWGERPLVMDKWYSVQAASVRVDIHDRIRRLRGRYDFDLRNPNRVRALAATFSMSNPRAFHAADGSGYAFLHDLILDIDPLNPALSARLATAFETWRTFDAARRTRAEETLRSLSRRTLSRNAADIVARALANPDPPAASH